MKKTLLLIALLAVTLRVAIAERADSAKPTEILADSASDDDVKQIRTLTGNVVLTRGTLIMKAGKAVVKTDPEGYSFATFTAPPGGIATFRQKRDGGDFWVEGQAERIEYDNKLEIVKLYSKAKLTKLEGTRATDEVEGAYISYDSRKEYFALENSTSGESKPGGGRVKMVIQPVIKPGPAPAGK
jgi:lipopolysaccharide export system protein LptA